MARDLARQRRTVHEPSSGAARPGPPFPRIEDDLRRALAQVPFGSAALAAIAGDRSHVFVLGNAAEGQPATPSTPFHICSCSKTFTAAVFSLLVADGAVSWDDPVRPVIPEFALPDAWVTEHCTYRDLAAMRVGLTRDGIAEWGFRQTTPKTERLRRARHMVLAKPFRDQFSYSNLCYIALALAAERIAGVPYADLLQRTICAPLELHDTWSGGTDVAPKGRPAQPHLPIDDKPVPVGELTGPNSEGSARVFISARDAVVWMRFLLSACNGSDAGPLSSAIVRQMASPQSILRDPGVQDSPEGKWSAYGYGLAITEFLGKPLLRHGGGGRGLRHALVLAPHDGIGVMLMVTTESAGIDGLALEILERLLTGKARQWRERFTANSQAMATEAQRSAEMQLSATRGNWTSADFVEGTYRNDVTGVVRLARERDSLRFLPDDAPIFAASLHRLVDGAYELKFDDPALTRQPLDPLFRLRFQASATARKLNASYFGELREVL